MNWWRAHHGISTDAKLAAVAISAGARRCEVGWIWIAMLDHASQEEERGILCGFDSGQIAAITDVPIATVDNILSAMKDRGMLKRHETPWNTDETEGNAEGRSSYVISAWDRRQPIREREDDLSTDRVRKFRNKKQKDLPPVTPGNAPKRQETPRVDEIRGDKKTTTTQLPCQSEYPLTTAAIRVVKPATDDIFVIRLVQEVIQFALSKNLQEELPYITDDAIARAVTESWRTGPKDHGAGLLLKTVPQIIATWAVQD